MDYDAELSDAAHQVFSGALNAQSNASAPKPLPPAVAARNIFDFMGGRLVINISNTSGDRIPVKLFSDEPDAVPAPIDVDFVLYNATGYKQIESETAGFYSLLHEMMMTQTLFVWAIGAGANRGHERIDIRNKSRNIGVGLPVPLEDTVKSVCLVSNDTIIDFVIDGKSKIYIEFFLSKADSWESHQAFFKANEAQLAAELNGALFDHGEGLTIVNQSLTNVGKVTLFDFNSTLASIPDYIRFHSWKRYHRFCMQVQHQPIMVERMRINSDNPAQMSEPVGINQMNVTGGSMLSLINPVASFSSMVAIDTKDYDKQFPLDGKTGVQLNILPATTITLTPFFMARKQQGSGILMGKSPAQMFGPPPVVGPTVIGSKNPHGIIMPGSSLPARQHLTPRKKPRNGES